MQSHISYLCCSCCHFIVVFATPTLLAIARHHSLAVAVAGSICCMVKTVNHIGTTTQSCCFPLPVCLHHNLPVTHLRLTAYWDLIAIACGMMTASWCYCHWCCIMKSSPVCCSNCSNRLPTCFMATAVEGWLMLFNVSSCWRTWRIACGSVSFSKIKAKECYKNSKGCFS